MKCESILLSNPKQPPHVSNSNGICKGEVIWFIAPLVQMGSSSSHCLATRNIALSS